jgi:hypothetical protein
LAIIYAQNTPSHTHLGKALTTRRFGFLAVNFVAAARHFGFALGSQLALFTGSLFYKEGGAILTVICVS